VRVWRDEPSAGARALAGLAAACAAIGGTTLAVAVLGTQGMSYPGYVSEAGVAGQPHWVEYRVGVLALGVALVLLAAATRRVLVPAALLLLVAGLLAGVSGSVSCSRGCPLPPFQTPTSDDLVHAGASVLGVGLCSLAILLFAVFGRHGPLRRVSRVAILPIIAVGLANAYGIAFVGRGGFTGVVERLMLVLIVAWCLAAAAALWRRGQPASARATA